MLSFCDKNVTKRQHSNLGIDYMILYFIQVCYSKSCIKIIKVSTFKTLYVIVDESLLYL